MNHLIFKIIYFSFSILLVSSRSKKSATEIKIIKEDKAFIRGLPINYKYNQTAIPSYPRYIHKPWFSHKLISSPGCPRSIDGIIEGSSAPWVHVGPNKCYVTGVQGPCPQGMKLSINPRSPLTGQCQCDCFFPTYQENIYLNKTWQPLTEQRPFCYDYSSKLHYAYVAEKNQCYPLLSQGPCGTNELLMLDSITNLPICEARKCPIGQFLYNNTNTCKKIGNNCEDEDTSYDSFESYEDVHIRGTPGRRSSYMEDVESNWIPQCKYEYRYGFGPSRPKLKYNTAEYEFDSKGYMGRQCHVCSLPSKLPPNEFCAEQGQRFSRLLKKCVDYVVRANRKNKLG